MRIVMISCFSSKETNSRANVIYHYFKDRHDECYLIYSEFNHNAKAYKTIEDDCWIPVKTIGYEKNLSAKRMISHFIFGVKAASQMKKLKPDLVYVAVPPNSAAYFASKAAKKLHLRFMVDIVDIWPESLPIPEKIKRLIKPFLALWKNLREKSLKNANVILYECDYYKEYFKRNQSLNDKSTTVYLSKLGAAKPDAEYTTNFHDAINICYLGSINYLIDIDFLINLMNEIKKEKSVHFHMIGIGERKDDLIVQLNGFEIPYTDYGAVYDEDEKSSIMAKCDFGYNVYKGQAVIGLTYKSVDYFSGGLPLINSIKGDTWKIIETRHAGINVDSSDFLHAARTVSGIGAEEMKQMKKNAANTYKECFSYPTLVRKMDEAVKTAFKK